MTSSKGEIEIPCTDIYPKKEASKATQSLLFEAITMTSAVWKSGDKGKITITFGGYNCDGCSPDAAWSQIGKNSNDIYPSMNLGFMDPPYGSFEADGETYEVPESATRNYCGTTGKESCREGWVAGATVIHEFGHALGMMHEHQNNLEKSNPIKLNKEAVVRYYDGIGLGEAGAATNVLERYECTDSNCDYAGTKFDPESIMLYYLPDDWIVGKNPTYPNFVLSKKDIGWLKQIYPLDKKDPPEITIEFVDRNPEPWKIAWVKKVVKETFEPLIGIKWNFIMPSSFKLVEGANKVNKANKAPPTSTSPSTSPPTDKQKVARTNLTQIELTFAIIVPVIVVIISFLIYYNRNKIIKFFRSKRR
jgi:hypothetical protein